MSRDLAVARANTRDWNRAHPERLREYCRRWYHKNRLAKIAYGKAYYRARQNLVASVSASAPSALNVGSHDERFSSSWALPKEQP